MYSKVVTDAFTDTENRSLIIPRERGRDGEAGVTVVYKVGSGPLLRLDL